MAGVPPTGVDPSGHVTVPSAMIKVLPVGHTGIDPPPEPPVVAATVVTAAVVPPAVVAPAVVAPAVVAPAVVTAAVVATPGSLTGAGVAFAIHS